jgi:hypothetical protein
MRIDIVHDFGSIMSMVSGETQELDFSSGMETWTMNNESEGGFGRTSWKGWANGSRSARCWASGSRKARAGASVVVRRLSRPSSGQMHVGVQTLSKGAIRVDVSATSDDGRNDALLLLSDSEGSAQTPELALMMPSGTFDAAKKFVVHTFGRTYPLTPKQLFERGTGYECARFRLAEAAATE